MRRGDGASLRTSRPRPEARQSPGCGQSRSRHRSCTDPRPGLRTSPQSGTSDAGREDRGPGVQDDAGVSPSSDPRPPRGERGECAPRSGLREGAAHSRPPGQSARPCGWWQSRHCPFRRHQCLKTDSVIARGACASPLTLGSAEDPQGAGPFCPGAPSQEGAWWEGICRTGPSLPASARSLLTLHFFLATER